MASTLFLILCCFAQVHAGTEISTSGRACHSVLVPIFSEERKKCEFRFDAVQIALMTLYPLWLWPFMGHSNPDKIQMVSAGHS
jgi:hypothetical protein